MSNPNRTPLVTLRRLSQVAFLLLFLALLPSTHRQLFLQADPFVALTHALATHALYPGLLLSLALLVPTLFLGRFFCGWICPLGTLHHFFSSIRSGWKRGRPRIESNRYKSWQTFKYYFLLALLAAAAFGSNIGGLMDPISLLARSFGLAILPVSHLVRALHQPHFQQTILFAAIFVIILASNLRITRLWCRALCPLGALLGICSRWSLVHLEKNADHCRDCNRCLLHCQGGDDPIPGAPWRKSECHLCMNCIAACPEHGPEDGPEASLRFRFFSPPANTVETPNLGRRQALTSLVAGAAALPFLRGESETRVDPRRIRPPGSLDEPDFLSRCIRCGECMKVCPNNALHPALQQAGVEGLWTPLLIPRIGYCDPACTLCGDVCPTGAIWTFTEKQKAWLGTPATKPIRLGTAFYDRGRCLPWAMATECIVCEEWCPTSPKAIYLQPAEVVDSAGTKQQLRQPWIDPQRCVGCGACEFACPVHAQPAIYVTAIGESRSKNNQFILSRQNPPGATLPASGDIPGWTQTRPTRSFEAANLWQYIDGDADRFLHAGIRQTLTSDYRFHDQLDVTIDLHIMSTAEAARQIMESESSAGSRAIAIGNACRLYGQTLTFRKAAYFVRLVAFNDTPQTEPALLDFARKMEQRLP